MLETETPRVAPETKPARHRRGAVPVLANLRSILPEFAIIAAGVLSALAAQAWWEGRQERGREVDYLHQLLTDTRTNESRLNVAIQHDSSTAASLTRLSNTLYRTGPLPPVDTVLRLFGGDTFNSSNFEPLSGTFSALIAAGDLRLIRNDSLRALVVAYASSLEYERSMLAFYLQQAFGNADRFVQAAPFVHRMFETGQEGIAREMQASGTTVAQLRANTNLAAILFALQAANSNRLMHLRTLRDETAALRRALEEEQSR